MMENSEEMRVQVNKFGEFCSHSQQGSLVNIIKVPCLNNSQLIHHISQMNKICDKCTAEVMNSLAVEQNCLICSDTLVEYLNERKFCPHKDRYIDEINIQCSNQKEQEHQITLQQSVCRRCHDRIKAALRMGIGCNICSGKQKQICNSIDKYGVSGTSIFFNNVIKYLNSTNAKDEIYSKQLQIFCLAEIEQKNIQISSLPKNVTEQSKLFNSVESHQSARYQLYPKCKKHRNKPLNLCNNCLVAILNLQICPYGCQIEKKVKQKKKQESTFIAESGFLTFYPKKNTKQNNSYFLQMFVFQLKQEQSSLDTWSGRIKKLKPGDEMTEKYQKYFPLYGAVALMGQNLYMISGGVLGNEINHMTPTNLVFLIQISSGKQKFLMREASDMKHKRASHSVINVFSENMLYAIGGFIKGQGFLKTCQRYSSAKNQWEEIGSLNIQRSKPSLIVYQQYVYAFGGLTNNSQYSTGMAEKYNKSENKWETLHYEGYQYPFITGCTSSSAIPQFQGAENIIIFGGSNTILSTYLIQNLQINTKQPSFAVTSQKYTLKMNYPRTDCQLGMMKTNVPNEKIVIIFGGLNQHEQLTSFDAVRVRNVDGKIEVMFPYDGYSDIGGYKLFNKYGNKNTYEIMLHKLTQMSIMNNDKLDHSQKSLQKGYNSQLLDKMWFTLGKSIAWVPLDSESFG